MDLFCSKKKWIIPEYDIDDIKRLCTELKISEILAMLLVARGIKEPSDARWFMNTSDLYLYDPFLLCDMDKAVERIKRAASQGEKICVYGDYDVDGITATAVLYSYLRSKRADVMYYIPQRLTEGYGMNREAVKKLSESGVKLIITVDNGITANEETLYAKQLGIDVVVTDHHECNGELPECCAVVNPKRPDNKYPFAGLAGVGVAFKLVCALEGENADESFFGKYIDLAALGTIADVMPLRDENRQIVAKGLQCFEKGSNIGVSALIDEALIGKNKNSERHINASAIGFTVAPRLNAAGRIGDVSRAVELLIAREPTECHKIADELCCKNRERQFIENAILNQAIEYIEKNHDFENDKVIVASAEGWHHGVVGIVASRITDKYGLPSILISCENGMGKGSARSIKGFNINEAIYECRDLLVRHGGHELAAGLTLEIDKIDGFREAINNIARNKIDAEMLEGSVRADAELGGVDISLEVCEEIRSLEPCGTDNPLPLLYMRDVEVAQVISLGQNKHTKLVLKKDDAVFDGLLFGFCPDNFIIPKTKLIDILFSLDINEFRGVRTPQVIIRDIRMSKTDAKYCAHEVNLFYEMLEGKHPSYAPSLDICRTVYRFLKTNGELLAGNVNAYFLAQRISSVHNINLTFPILGVILEVFSEMGLCELVKSDETVMHIKLLENTGKVDIEASHVLARVRNTDR